MVEYTLPEYWACYLVNGDADSLSGAERAKVDAFLKEKGLVGASVSCSEQSYFARSQADHGPKCNVLDYTFLLP